MISPASLLHTPLTTPPSKHFCSWLSCSTEASFRVFWGKTEQTTSRRDHTAQHAFPVLPSTGQPALWLQTRTRAPLSEMLLAGDGGSRAFPAFLQGSRRFADHADPAERPVLSLSACASGCTPGLCWAVRKMLPIPWGEGRHKYV